MTTAKQTGECPHSTSIAPFPSHRLRFFPHFSVLYLLCGPLTMLRWGCVGGNSCCTSTTSTRQTTRSSVCAGPGILLTTCSSPSVSGSQPSQPLPLLLTFIFSLALLLPLCWIPFPLTPSGFVFCSACSLCVLFFPCSWPVASGPLPLLKEGHVLDHR